MATTALGTVIPGWALDDAAAMERLDVDLLARAYRFSERAHAGQKRSSGDAYVSHCVEVAKILAELHLDSVTVASGLIHDVIEDTGVSAEEIEREFGTEIASIVDGVTKIGNITFRSTQERQVENYRKLLLSIAKDARVILIKLADRLHNMRTLDYLAEEKQREKPYEEIYDLMAIRVLVNTVPECYHALGLIHEGWTPLQERIKDYIAQPKSNGYQSLHTTIFGPGKQLFEIQIRTREMHRTAEFGIAAHWLYKESSRGRDDLDEKLGWFREILAMQLDAKTPDEFLEFLKLDLYQDEIFVFTPTGDVIQLPKGATPIDFAFAVHTEIGVHCQGAKVNGKIAPLSRQLRNSDQVEILTSASARPSRDWLAHVRTGRARHKIRQWIRNEEQATSAKLGRDMLDREVKRRRVERPNDDQLLTVAKQLSLTDVRHLIASIGQGDVNVSQVLKLLYPDADGGAEPPAKAASAFERLVDRMRGTTRGVRIQGVDGLMIRYSQCCQPVPGDPVVGYVTRGRGVSIHRSDCPNLLLLSAEPERRLEIDWQELEGELFVVRLGIEGTDRRGLYADLAAAVTETGTNIKSIEMRSGDGGVFGSVLVEVENLSHLQKIVKAIRRVKGVTDVARRERVASE